jgi:trimethylamine:corrinoid methyltransferase-like protein
MGTRAREKAKRVLAEHQPPPLADRIVAQLDEIMQEAESQAAIL